MGHHIEIYTCVVVTAFLVEIVAIIIHGTPLALLAYAVTIVLVFTAIMVALNFHNRNNNDNDRDRSNGVNIELTEEELNKRRTYLGNMMFTKVVDNDLLARSFPSTAAQNEIDSNNKDEEIQQLNNDIDNNEETSIFQSYKENELIDIESVSPCPKCNDTNNNNNNNQSKEHSNINNDNNNSLFKLDAPICSICLSNKNIGDTIVYSKNNECNHTFHKECLILWFLAVMKKDNSLLASFRDEENQQQEMITNIASYTCPNCRSSFI